MKSSIKKIAASTCCSYTVVIITNIFLFSKDYMMTIGVLELRQTFWICLITSTLVRFSIDISYKKEWMTYAASFIVMHLSVFGFGTFVFHLIPLKLNIYVSVSIMIAVVYLVCMGLVYAVEKSTADEINEKLSHKVKQRKEGHHGKDN